MVYFISFALYMLRLRIKVSAENGRVCPYCKYSLMNLPQTGYCPECGRPCPKDYYLSFWSRLFWASRFDLVIPERSNSKEHVRLDNFVRRLLFLANIALSLAILFWLLPSMNCMTVLLRGCKCYSESKEFPQLLDEVLVSMTVSSCFYIVVGSSLEWRLFNFYLHRKFGSSRGAEL